MSFLVWRRPKVGDLVHPLKVGTFGPAENRAEDHRVGLVLQERGLEVKIQWPNERLWHKRTQVIVITKENDS